VILLSLTGLIFRGLNLSIDFEGGAQLRYLNRSGASVADVTAVLSANGHANSEVQIVNGDSISIRTTTLTNDATARDKLLSALATRSGISQNDISQEDVGPTWGSEISRKALVGLVVVLAAIFAYIWLRFEWKMALGANVALVHDLIITVGVYAVVGRQVTPATVIAVLTILGFSLYDTVVIYDKIKENTESNLLITKLGFNGVVDLSLRLSSLGRFRVNLHRTRRGVAAALRVLPNAVDLERFQRRPPLPRLGSVRWHGWSSWSRRRQSRTGCRCAWPGRLP